MADVFQLRADAVRTVSQSHINPSIVDAQKDRVVECQDSRMRQHWDRIVCEELGVPDRYQHVAVLIVRWVKELDSDLDCESEVNELDRLLSSEFGFESKIVKLGVHKRPQNQLDSEVANFVLEHDGPHRSHLLIVYYTGHGQVSTVNGSEELIIAGTRSPEHAILESNHVPTAVWSQAVKGLNTAEADVLEILDCCFAGNIMKNFTEHIRTYEMLVAAGRDMMTPKPGPRSYTRALIDSLKDELRENLRRPFATHDLNQRIHQKRMWKATHGAPVLFTRFGPAITRHICLAPLHKHKEVNVKPPSKYSGALNLRLAFAEASSLDEKQVAVLARNMSAAAKSSELKIIAIDWMGFQPRRDSEHFKSTVRAIRLIRNALKRRAQKLEQRKKKRKLNEEIQQSRFATKNRRMSTMKEVTEEMVNRQSGSGPPTPGATPCPE